MTDETMYDYFNDNIENSGSADEALKWSEAFKNTVEANNNEYQQVQRNETEIKKERIKIGVAVITALGSLAVAGVKLYEVLTFQKVDQQFEEKGFYVNHKKHRMQFYWES